MGSTPPSCRDGRSRPEIIVCLFTGGPEHFAVSTVVVRGIAERRRALSSNILSRAKVLSGIGDDDRQRPALSAKLPRTRPFSTAESIRGLTRSRTTLRTGGGRRPSEGDVD